VNALLCIMNPRRIPACLESYDRLDIDRAYMTGFRIADLVAVHHDIVASTDFDVYLNVSDDCVVSQDALDAVLALLEGGAEAATGWCRLHGQSPWSNLCHSPLVGNLPRRRNYPFYLTRDVEAYPDEVVPTHFMGMSLTGMTRDLWREFPYGCFAYRDVRGHSSDYHLSMRLRDARVPMVAARSGYVDHLKPYTRVHGLPDEFRLLAGHIPSEVRFEQRVPRATDPREMAVSVLSETPPVD
jgi:hypothetical protein